MRAPSLTASDSLRKAWADPIKGLRMRAAIKESWQGERRTQRLAKMSEKARVAWEDPSYRERMVANSQKAWDKRRGRLTIDHSHATGEVRGCLCHRCNLAIGYLDDSISRLEAAIAYLKRERTGVIWARGRSLGKLRKQFGKDACEICNVPGQH